VNGVAKLLAEIDQHGIENVRVRAGDALELIEAAPAASFSRIFLLYPDPWPKRRQNKRRLVSEAMIAELARVARPGRSCALPPTSTITPAGRCAAFSPRRTLHGRPGAPTTGESPGRDGPRPAMRPRREARGGVGLFDFRQALTWMAFRESPSIR